MTGLQWWHVYFFTRIDSFVCLFTFMSIVVSIAAVVYVLLSLTYDFGDSRGEDLATGKKLRKKNPHVIAISILFWIVLAMIPSQKEVAAIYLLPKLANSKAMSEAEKLPETFVKLLDVKMKEWIDTSIKKEEKSAK